MPIYEYRCGKCNHKFDALQKMDEDGTGLKCPQCGADNPVKILSAFSGSDPSGKPSSSCKPRKGFG